MLISTDGKATGNTSADLSVYSFPSYKQLTSSVTLLKMKWKTNYPEGDQGATNNNSQTLVEPGAKQS